MRRRTCVTAFCQQAIPSAVLGVMKPMQFLMDSEHVAFEFVESTHLNKNHLVQSDIIICIRGSERLELRIMQEAKRLGKYLIYFLDDDLLNVPDIASSSLYFKNGQVRDTILSIMKCCHSLWTTNKNIALKYNDLFDKSVVVDAPAIILPREPDSVSGPARPVSIGFAGSVDHAGFLQTLLKEPLLEIKRLFPDVAIEFIGAKPLFVEQAGFTHFSYMAGYDDYNRFIGSRHWDIGLAPLPDGDFYRCKYFNKYIEYAGKRIAGIYSHVEPYTFVVEEGRNGLLVNNDPDDWFRAIRRLVEDVARRREIAERGFADVNENYSLKKVSGRLTAALPEIVEYRAPVVEAAQVKYTVGIRSHRYHKLISALKRERWKFPAYLYKKIFRRQG